MHGRRGGRSQRAAALIARCFHVWGKLRENIPNCTRSQWESLRWNEGFLVLMSTRTHTHTRGTNGSVSRCSAQRRARTEHTEWRWSLISLQIEEIRSDTNHQVWSRQSEPD